MTAIRDATNCRLLNCRVKADRLLNHARVNLESACNNHVLDAIDNEEIAIFIHGAEVTGIEAPTLKHRASLALLLPITGHNLRSGDANFPDLAKRKRFYSVVERGDIDDRSGEGET